MCVCLCVCVCVCVGGCGCVMNKILYSSMFCQVHAYNTVKNKVEWIFLILLSCLHLYTSCWFLSAILSLTKSLPENVTSLSSWDLFPCNMWIWIYLNVYIWWQVCKSLGITWTSVSDNALQMFFPKHSQQEEGLTLLPLFCYILN